MLIIQRHAPHFLYNGAMCAVGHAPWVPEPGRGLARAREEQVVRALGWQGWSLDKPDLLHRLLGHAKSGGSYSRSRHLQVEGLGVRIQYGGWTVLHFWDRGGDSRYGSNSVFAREGDWTSEEVIEHARRVMPACFWLRRSFEFDIQESR